jgi:hypothetical protein
MARSVGESNLASRQRSRQPSLSGGVRHMARVKRLELMACQPAGPICCGSVRPWTRTWVHLSETWRSSLSHVSHVICVCPDLVSPGVM